MAKKKFISFAAAFVAAAQALTFVTSTGVAEQTVPDANTGYISADVLEDLPDNDELLNMYLENMFFGGGIALYKDYGLSSLTGTAREIYDALRSEIEKIAADTLTSSVFSYTPKQYYTDKETFSSDISTALSYLLIDMPEEFYWYDKTVGVRMMYSVSTVGSEERYVSAQISLSVASDYKGSGEFTVDSSKITAAQNAIAKADSIIQKYNGKTAAEKVKGYKDEICALTSYNNSAVGADSSVIGINPWQLVYVFDGDASTNVVCEGYSKAFQYLCDEGGVECYTVSGVMTGGTGAGGHMWNIVVLDGKSYLVDVTNCDAGTVGYPDELCLKGAVTGDASGCSFNANGSNISYVYYKGEPGHDNIIAMYPASLRTVSTEDYTPSAAHVHTLGKWEADGENHVQKCTECKEIVNTEAHSYGTWNSDKNNHWKVCTVCGAKGETAAHVSSGAATEEKAEICTVCAFEINPKLDHTHVWDTEWSHNDTQHWHKCTTCTTGEDTRADHVWGEGEVTKAATCTEDGVRTFTCVCGATKTEAVKATGHSYGEGTVTKAATCTENGEKTYACANCTYKKTEVIKAVGHIYDEGAVTTEPTCTEPGVKTFSCKSCGNKKTEEVAATGHKFGDTWVKGDGNHTNSCTVCGEKITEPHKFEVGEFKKAPTCTEAGEREDVCVCGETKTVAVEALGHEPGEAVRENEVPATADKDGSYDSVVYCTRCKAVISTTTITIPKTGTPSDPSTPSEPTTPTTPATPTTPTTPTTPSDPETPSAPNEPGNDEPFIKGESGKNGWEAIGDDIKSAGDSDVISVDMNKATVVPKSVFEKVRGKDVIVSFEMDNDFVWSVNGKSVADGDLADIDFSVKTGSSLIPESVMGTVTGEKIFTQLSLAHDGEFGFNAVLSVNVGKSNANLLASLYYYNDGKLDKIGTEKIGNDGVVKLSFKHASDYLITVHEEKNANEPSGDQNTSTPDNTEKVPSDNPDTGIKEDSLLWIAALSCLVLTAPIFKRAKKSGK